MISFFDLTSNNKLRLPCCAFMQSRNLKFIENTQGFQVFSSIEDVLRIHPSSLRQRCINIMPCTFFSDLSNGVTVVERPESIVLRRLNISVCKLNKIWDFLLRTDDIERILANDEETILAIKKAINEGTI